jgi:pilus assembly protein FimV
VRKSGIILSLWTALLCFPLSSFALGLGEIEVNSYLNQPLKAEIEVVNARPGEIDDLLVSLASRDAFRKAGLDRASDLSKLRFQIEKSEDGEKATILVTTKSAIKEPFLNFLIEAD